MGFVECNLNPLKKKNEDDCMIRAIAMVLDQTWDKTYMELSLQGFQMKSTYNKNYVWGAYLKSKGFERFVVPNTCPDCYTVSDFCNDNPNGTYLIATDGHVVAVKDGNYYDNFDSGDKVPLYYWKREEKK